MAQRNLTALLCGVLVGCAPDARPLPPGDGGPDANDFVPSWCKPSLAAGPTASAIVGEGQTFYRDIPENAELFWEKGPQGGHHVWIAVRMRGLRMRGTIITVNMHDVEDPANPRLVNNSRLIYDFDKDEGWDPQLGGFCTRPGLRMQLDNAGGPTRAELHGLKIRVVVSLRDPDGHTAEGTRTIIVKGDLS